MIKCGRLQADSKCQRCGSCHWERSLQEWDLPVKRFRVDGISYESFQFRHAGSFLGVFLPFRHRSGQLRAVNITIRKRVAKRSRLWAMILVFPAVLLALANASSSKAEDVFQQNNRLGRGVNLQGWDAIWDDPDRSRFEAIDFRLIREAGFNHVRVNLHPLRDGRPDPGGKLREEFFETMDWSVDHALSNQLRVILDFHDDLAISPDPEGKRKDFLAAWKAIADHCRNRPSTVMFEILNEPAPKFTHESWEEYWRAALAIIRQSNPDRTVIIGPAQWNGVGELDHLSFRPKIETSSPRCITIIPFRSLIRERPGQAKKTRSE